MSIQDLFVWAFLHTERSKDIAKVKSTILVKGFDLSVLIIVKMFEKNIEIGAKWCTYCIFHSIHHPHSIIVVDETITKHSCDFVSPKSSGNIRVWNFFLGAEANAANNFANVTQVESVM